MRDATQFDRWAAAALLGVTLALLAALPAWWMTDSPPAFYAEPTDAFRARVEQFASDHAAGATLDNLPLVAPPPGDVPMLAERFRFWPALRLKAGQTYRLHVASTDTMHSMVVDGTELFLIPGEVRILTLTPRTPGRLAVLCNEYCGLGHNKMRGVVEVVP